MAQQSMRFEAAGRRRSTSHPPELRRVVVCAHCGDAIGDPPDAFLLRNAYALPEEPTFHVHAGCMEAFTAHRPARWERTPLSTTEASRRR